MAAQAKSITAYQKANQLAASELDVLYGVTGIGIAVKKHSTTGRKVAAKRRVAAKAVTKRK